jgi:hypothetical protein
MNYNSMNNGPRISEMGGGTPISQLRKDVADTLSQKAHAVADDVYERASPIKHIIEDINNDNEIATRKKTKIKKETTEESEEDKEEKKVKNEKKKDGTFLYNVPSFIKDPILIWVIFILMSQNFFKSMVSKYLKSIIPNESGVVGFTGVAIYGLVLVVLYTLIKFVLQSLKVY